MEDKKLLLNTSIELIDSDESFASVSLNPFIQWAKIVITDDQPNANKQRIPLEEFDNLIKTGIHAPIKMEFGSIKDHKDAKGKPIGVIANIIKEANKLIALAAFWKKEREEDVAMLKDMYLKEQPPQTSWEISFTESSFQDEIEELKGTILNGLAIVANPAYTGRTSFVAMASVETEPVTAELSEAAVWTTAYINDLPDSAFLYIESGGEKDEEGKTKPRSLRHFPYKDKEGKIDLPHLRNAIARIPQANIPEEKKTQLQAKARKLLGNQKESSMTIEELEAKVAELEKTLTQKDEELKELEELRNYKANAEKAKADETKMASIKNKFKEAKIEKEDQYFNDNREKFLGMDDSLLDFVIQEMVSFSSKNADASDKNPKIPNFKNNENDDDLKDPKKLANALRELRLKK